MSREIQLGLEALDVPRLVDDIKRGSIEVGVLKKALRVPWKKSMAAEQVRLVRLKRRITALCVLRAWMRGRYHITRRPHDSNTAGSIRMWCWGGGEDWDHDKFAKLVVANEAPAYQLVPTNEKAARCSAASNAAMQVDRP